MRVLLITPRPPAPRLGGDRLRLHELVRFLGARHELVLVTLAEDRRDELAARSLQDRVSRLTVVRHPRSSRLVRTAAGLALPHRPLQVSYFHATSLVRAARACGPVDVVLGSLIRTAPAVLALDVPAVVDMQDAISLHYRRARPYLSAPWRALYGIEQPRVEAFERAVARRAAAVSMISTVDRDDLLRRCPDARIAVAGNGVDQQRFRPDADVQPVPDRWVFLGNLRTLANRDMVTHLARDVVPLLAASRPSAQLRIVGTQPGDDVLRLHDGQRVVVVGPVDDPAEHLQRAWMTVCPMRFGAGVQNKVLESLAVGTPVVLTRMAAEPLGLHDGDGVVVRDGAAGIAGACEELFADAALRHRLAMAARRVVEQRFDWDDALAPLESLLVEVAST